MKKNSPLLIIILALGVFGIITTEMGIVGVLPQITQKFNISTAQAGLLVSVFALVVAVSGPFVTLLAFVLILVKLKIYTTSMGQVHHH